MEITGFYKEVIEKLNKNNVEFLLVGGLAVGFHGYARFTGDMDLWINPVKDNLRNLVKTKGCQCKYHKTIQANK